MKINLKETHQSIFDLLSLFNTKVTENYQKQASRIYYLEMA